MKSIMLILKDKDADVLEWLRDKYIFVHRASTEQDTIIESLHSSKKDLEEKLQLVLRDINNCLGYNLEIGWSLVFRFIQEIEKAFSRKVIFKVYGSLANGKYIHEFSDIDLLIFPEEGFFKWEDFDKMQAIAEKYGTINRAGTRMSRFDILFFPDPDEQKHMKNMLKAAAENNKNAGKNN